MWEQRWEMEERRVAGTRVFAAHLQVAAVGDCGVAKVDGMGRDENLNALVHKRSVGGDCRECR